MVKCIQTSPNPATRGLALEGPRSPRYACIARQVLGRVQENMVRSILLQVTRGSQTDPRGFLLSGNLVTL